MNTVMIPAPPDALSRLLTLRQSESESLGEALSRILAGAVKPAVMSAENTATTPRPQAKEGGVSYQLLGETQRASNATEAMIKILRNLAQYDDEFFPKLAARVGGRTRNHIARSRSEVYPRRSDLMRYVKEIDPSWFVGCNIANREKENILRAACKAVGITLGRDFEDRLACT